MALFVAKPAIHALDLLRRRNHPTRKRGPNPAPHAWPELEPAVAVGPQATFLGLQTTRGPLGTIVPARWVPPESLYYDVPHRRPWSQLGPPARAPPSQPLAPTHPPV